MNHNQKYFCIYCKNTYKLQNWKEIRIKEKSVVRNIHIMLACLFTK